MSLTTDRELKIYTARELIDVPVDDNAVIRRGALVGRNRGSGFARALVAGDEFLGLAYRMVENTGPGHAPGAVSVRLHQDVDVVFDLAGIVMNDLGKDVSAVDDATLTLSPVGTSRVGRIVGLEGAGQIRVRLQPLAGLCGLLENEPVVNLMDASAGLTLDHINHVLLIANSAARALTLPPISGARAGAWIRVIKTSATAAAVTLDGYGAETINGAQTFTGIDAQYDTVQVICTGAGWNIVSRDLA